jgi:hypothetical protein
MEAVRAAQSRRVERLSGDAPPGPAPAGGAAKAGAGGPPPRAAMVADYVALGMSPAAAGELYDRQLREWEAARGRQ